MKKKIDKNSASAVKNSNASPDTSTTDFPLELVANVAVQLIAAKLVPVENPLKTNDAAFLEVV